MHFSTLQISEDKKVGMMIKAFQKAGGDNNFKVYNMEKQLDFSKVIEEIIDTITEQLNSYDQYYNAILKMKKPSKQKVAKAKCILTL